MDTGFAPGEGNGSAVQASSYKIHPVILHYIDYNELKIEKVKE